VLAEANLYSLRVGLSAITSGEGQDALIAHITRRCVRHRKSLRYPEGHVAGERAAGRDHLDCARGCPGRYCGGDLRTRYDLKGCRGAVEGHVGCTRQVCSQDDDGRAHLARGRQRLDEWAQAHVKAVDRAASTGPWRGRPVEDSVGGLSERGLGAAALIQLCEPTRQGKLKDCTAPFIPWGGPIQVPIGPLN
jgi:hypothetical protein